MNTTRNQTRQRGFSLAEFLTVVLIMSVLFALVSVNGVQMLRNVRQTVMDRQAEQIFLAMSRNLQGIEAAGNVSYLNQLIENITQTGAGHALFDVSNMTEETDAPKLYAFTNASEAGERDSYFEDMDAILFPTANVSGVISPELRGGRWVILFTPGADTKNDDDPNVIQRLSASPAVYGVYFASGDEQSETYFAQVLKQLGADGTDKAYYSNRKCRLNDLNGYVGYYGGESDGGFSIQSNKTRKDFTCYFVEDGANWQDNWNTEELSVEMQCAIPQGADAPEFDNQNVMFQLTLTGTTSGQSVTFDIYPSGKTNQRFGTFPSYGGLTLVLDKLGSVPYLRTGGTVKYNDIEVGDNFNFNREWKESWGNFLNAKGLYPGEGLKLNLQAYCYNDRQTPTEGFQAIPRTKSDDYPEPNPTINSLFADSSVMTAAGDKLNAKIAYGRHLQNLDRQIGGFWDGIQPGGFWAKLQEIRATQIKDISFSDENGVDNEKWAKTYADGENVKTFLPITNERLVSYDGGGKKIIDLRINYNLAAANRQLLNEYKENAGLFGTFKGDTLQNITLVNPVITGASGTKNAGGLVGLLSMSDNVTIRNCSLYLEKYARPTDPIQSADPSENPDNGMSWLSTATVIPDETTDTVLNAGGLVGVAEGGKKLTITSSFASTVIKAGYDNSGNYATGCHAGGLVGMAADNVTVDIEKCYTGSYIYGYHTGGLVGGAASVSLKNCYAAGFQYGAKNAESYVAGLVNGAVSHMENCYTISVLNPGNEIGHKYMTAASLTTGGDVTHVYYRMTNTPKWGSVDFSLGQEEEKNIDELGAKKWYQNDGPAIESYLGSEFVLWNGIGTHPYNLRKQDLTEYHYPRLKSVAYVGGAYYGDWKPDLGMLAYYERYMTSGGETAYGFRVEGENALWNPNPGAGHFADGWKITGDGYGILFEVASEAEDPLKGNENNPEDNDKQLSVSFGGIDKDNKVFYVNASDGNRSDEEDKVIIATHGDTTNVSFTVSHDGNLYRVYPIANAKLNRALYSGDEIRDADRTFYQWARICVAEKDNPDVKYMDNIYRFNPHFAASANMISRWANDEDTDTLANDRERLFPPDTTSETLDPVSIRTARQLNSLSRYYESDYYSVLRGKATDATFSQDCDIDYRAYDWDHYAPQYRPDPDKEWNDTVQWEQYAKGSTYYDAKTQTSQNDKAAFVQPPIGAKRLLPFVNAYDGNCRVITGVSVMGDKDSKETRQAVGLFGWNAGKISNVVFAAPFDRDDLNSPYAVGRKKSVGAGGDYETLYIGALTGYNLGAVDNCAVAGYYLGAVGDMRDPATTADANAMSALKNEMWVSGNSVLYAGGLVGYNAGTIQNASCSMPKMLANVHIANAYVGGFAGWNSGNVADSYALGWVDASISENTSVAKDRYRTSLAGFCAGGTSVRPIVNCYCAVALSATGEANAVNAFAPSALQVVTSYYLKGPTFKFLGVAHNYNNDSDKGQPKNETELQAWAAGRTADSMRWHDMPKDENAFRYPAYVKGPDGKPCHYGNWLEEITLGYFGMFYWENEEGGSNPGYHISYLGVYDGTTETGGTLCNRHHDGGLIREYGYGYYQLQSDVNSGNTLRLSVSNLSYSTQKWNKTVASEFEKQWPAYVFYPYATRTQTEADGGDFITMTGKADGAMNVLNGTFTLRLNSRNLSATYAVSPFFANAMQLTQTSGAELTNIAKKDDDNRQTPGYTPAITSAATVLNDSGTGVETRIKYFNKDLGKEDNRYEIRSVRQLQYLNWNYAKQNTTTLVTKENCAEFNYLTSYTGSGTQKVSKNKGVVNNVRNDLSGYYWWQTHDAEAPQVEKTPVEEGGVNFTPIAGATTSTTRDDNKGTLYGWFDGHFDGQSYVLKNIEIHSDSFTVGVFGQTVSADIKNVILYSDNDNVIERVTDNEKLHKLTGAYGQARENKHEKLGAYLIGGLIALAYDYNPSASDKTNTIRNCSVSGYRIVDSSTNPHGRGGGNIGGLLGVAYATIEKCSAVTDIYINCMPVLYEYTDNGVEIKRARYGSYVKVGGLVGAIQYEAKNCYTGGTINVDEYTKYVMRYNDNFRTILQDGTIYQIDNDLEAGPNVETIDGKKAMRLDDYLTMRKTMETVIPVGRENNLHIHIGGVAGCTYAANYTNFINSAADRQATFTNCYTYTQLPRMQGNIKCVSYIGGVADRFSNDSENPVSKITIENCWYLDGISEDARIQADKTAKGEIYEPDVTINHRWYVTTVKNPGSKAESDLLDVEQTKLYFDGTNKDSFGKRDLDWETQKVILDGNLYLLRAIQYNANDGNSSNHYWTHYAKDKDPKNETYSNMNVLGENRQFLSNLNGGETAWQVVTRVTDLEGRYSFPGSDLSELGTEYPFPTVITQYDPDIRQVVSVHYGRWPQDSVYWDEAIADMDIFGDMRDSGWAEHEFILHGVTGDAPTKTDITFSKEGDEAIAEVAGIKPGEKSGDYIVTIRALRPGNVWISYQEYVKFRLTVTATGVKVEDTFTPRYVFASDKDNEKGDVAFTLYAKNENGLPLAKSAENWTIVGTDVDINAKLKAQDADPVFLIDKDTTKPWKECVSFEDGTAHYQARTKGVAGEFFVTATFVYDYHGFPLPPVPVTTSKTYALGVAGLSDGENFRDLERQSKPKDGGGAYSPTERKDKEDYNQLNRAVPQKPDGADLFLYETVTDVCSVEGELLPALGAAQILYDRVQITDKDGENYPVRVKLSDGEIYNPVTEPVLELIFSDVTTDGEYQYRAVAVRQLKEIPVSDSELSVTIPVEYTDNGVTVLYEFSETIDVDAVQTYAVTLHANGGDVTLQTDEGDVTLNENGWKLYSTYHAADGETYPESGYYVTLPKATGTKSLHMLDGWSLAPMGERDYEQGETIRITSDTDLYAHWVRDKVTVYFYARLDELLADRSDENHPKALTKQTMEAGEPGYLETLEEILNESGRPRDELSFIGWLRFSGDENDPAMENVFYDDAQRVNFPENVDVFLYPQIASVTLHGNGGSVKDNDNKSVDGRTLTPEYRDATEETPAGWYATIPSVKGTLQYHQFRGWADSANPEKIWQQASGEEVSVRVPQNMDLNAVWERDTVTVYFYESLDALKANEPLSSQTLKAGVSDKLKSLNDLQDEKLPFDGWLRFYDESIPETLYPDDKDVTFPNKDETYNYPMTVRLYPKLKTVTLRANGGNLLDANGDSVDGKILTPTYKAAFGDKPAGWYVTLPNVETSEHERGAKFAGWTREADASQPLDVLTNDGEQLLPVSSENLYAYWKTTAHFYDSLDTLLADYRDGSTDNQLDEQSENFGNSANLTLLDEQQASDLFFSGWLRFSEDPEEDSEIVYGNGAEMEFSGDCYLYARTKIPVNFMVNGEPETHWFTRDENSVETDGYPNPTFGDGVTLLGWYDAKNDGATEVVRTADTRDENDQPLSSPILRASPIIPMNADDFYKLYLDSDGVITLYSKCQVALAPETRTPTFGSTIVNAVSKPHTFVEQFDDVRFLDGDEVIVSMKLGGWPPEKQNLVSFGTTQDGATNFDKGDLGIHVTYPRNDSPKGIMNGIIRLANKAQIWNDAQSLGAYFPVGTPLTITVNSSGVTLRIDMEGKDPVTIYDKSNTFSRLLGERWAESNPERLFFVASWDGSQRSQATDYVITVNRTDRIRYDVAAAEDDEPDPVEPGSDAPDTEPGEG